MEFNQTGPILTLGNLVGRASWTEIWCLYSFLLYRINDIDIHNINHKCMYTGCLKKRSHKERRGFQAAVKADIALTVLHWVVLYYDCTIRLKTHSPNQQTSPKTPLSTFNWILKETYFWFEAIFGIYMGLEPLWPFFLRHPVFEIDDVVLKTVQLE